MSAAFQEEIHKLKKENAILKAVLASVVIEGNTLFKSEDLTVDVSENAEVLIHGEAETGSKQKGFISHQFSWRYSLSDKANSVSAENRHNNGLLLRESNSEQKVQEYNNSSLQDHNNAPLQDHINAPLQEHKNILTVVPVHQEPDDRQLSKKYKVFVKLDNGEKRELDVESTDTIKRVKTRIQEKFGFNIDKQVLRYLGPGVMEDGRTVSDYFIKNHSEIFLTVMTRTNIQICIKMIIGTGLEMEIESTKSLGDLKSMIEKFKGIPVDRQRLVFGGKQLQNSTTLEYNNIENGATIHLL